MFGRSLAQVTKGGTPVYLPVSSECVLVLQMHLSSKRHLGKIEAANEEADEHSDADGNSVWGELSKMPLIQLGLRVEGASHPVHLACTSVCMSSGIRVFCQAVRHILYKHMGVEAGGVPQ